MSAVNNNGTEPRQNGYKTQWQRLSGSQLPPQKELAMNRSRLGASPETVKLCGLCGTLNLETNKDCWTCGWHGNFDRDVQTIALAWQRIEAQHEEVRVEHLTARRTAALGDFGAARRVSPMQKLLLGARAWWQRFQDARELRAAQRQARLHSRTPTPPDQLGV